jgi:hypothetical protein
MECQVLNDLEFHLSVPTTKTFFFFQVGNHCAMSNMTFSNVFGLIRRLLREVQTSRKVRLSSCVH